ncbi:hypothetical protein D3C80_1794610 [compost metagenome]
MKHHSSVHDVLGGGAPVHVAASFATELGQLLHQGQDRVTNDLGFVLHQRQIEGLVARQLCDLNRCLSGNHATACFSFRQRDFNLNVPLNERLIGEHRTHLGGAEHVTEQGGIEDSGGHGEHPKIFIGRTYFYVRT